MLANFAESFVASHQFSNKLDAVEKKIALVGDQLMDFFNYHWDE